MDVKALAPGTVDLWLTDYSAIEDERLHGVYRDLLNEEERKQEPRFYFARDRRRYLVTRALVRTVLSRYLPIEPKDWVFANNEYGRPRIANDEACDVGLMFNISHTHSMIAMGVAHGRELGVDVENIQAREVSIDIADRFFAPAEVAALATVPRERQQYRFFEYWTFKESYIKARGMGLSLPLDKFSFHFARDDRVALEVDAELNDTADKWRFWQFRPEPEYLLAVCVERGVGPMQLAPRKIVPLRDEVALDLVALRTSE